MTKTGRCYCGELQYEAEGEPVSMGQCHCRECQYISGGSPNVVVMMPMSGFKFTKGTPKQYTRPDLEAGVTREFCGNCGTHIGTRTSRMPDVYIIKVGTFDDPSFFKPQLAAYAIDKQPFHLIPEGIPVFERLPDGFAK